MNARRGFNNVMTSILNQVITLALGIIIPRLVLVNLGSETNGLLNSINQVLVYVSLLEAGVGTASLQALYGPVAKDDKDAINRILAATHRFYKRTGRIYLAVVLVLALVFPFTIDTELSHSTVMLLMLLSGLPGVVNYYFQGKFRVLLQAEGKDYIITSLSTLVHIFTSLSKIALLLAGFDVIALQLMYLVFNLIQVFCILVYIKKNYHWIDLSVEPNYQAISQSKNVLSHQISGLVYNNTDTLVLTYFCGFKTVSVYSLYSMLLSMVDTMIGNFFGLNFILGQAFQENKERYLKLHNVYELYMMTLSFSLFCIAGLFILPFMSLYTSGITDIEYVDAWLPVLFISIYLLSKGRTASMHVINFAGHFKQTQWHAFLEAGINVVASLVAVTLFGIYGVLMGTIVALLFRTNAMILYANRKILGRNPWITYRRWLLNLALFIIVTVAGKWFFSFIVLDSYLRIIGWAVVTCIVVIPFFFGVVSLCEREVFRFAWELLKPYLQKVKEKCLKRA